MPIKTVGILSPGDMDQAIAVVLSQQGLRTSAALDKQSGRPRQLVAAATIEDLGFLKHLVAGLDTVLSVLVPAAANQAAQAIAIRVVGKPILFAYGNAIASTCLPK